MPASEFDMRRYNGDANRQKQACPQGHPLFGDNLLPADLARGKRGCKRCAYDRNNAYRRAKREERDS